MTRLAVLHSAALLMMFLAGACGSSREADNVSRQNSVVDSFAKIPSAKTIHIQCMGAGSPTVIFTAGAGDWSGAWRNVQPQVAQTTRACAWDRPDSGQSSSVAKLETVVETTADLEAALKVARIHGPYVAVGHSVGSYESLLFKDQNPGAVVGMVLVDPSIPDQVNRMTQKLPAAAHLPQPKTPSFAMLQTDSKLVLNPKRNYGHMPLVVLSATKTAHAPGLPAAVIAELPAAQAEWLRGHRELAGLSSRGIHRLVPNSGHLIQSDQPEWVIKAIQEVVSVARAERGEHR